MATPLIPFAIVWLIGIWLASRVALPTVALGVATGVVVLGIIFTWRAPKPRWMFILALAAILGAVRYNLAQPHFDQTSLATYNDQQKSVTVGGIVVSEPDARDAYTNLRVESDKLIISDQPMQTVKGWVLMLSSLQVKENAELMLPARRLSFPRSMQGHNPWRGNRLRAIACHTSSVADETCHRLPFLRAHNPRGSP